PTRARSAGALGGPRVGHAGIALLDIGDEQIAAGLVAGHVENRIAGILDVEQASAGTERPTTCRTVGKTESRGEIVVVRVYQTASHVLIPGLHKLSISEAKIQALVEVALARPRDDRKLGVGQEPAGTDARIE